MKRYRKRKPIAGVVITCRIYATRKNLQKITDSQKALYRGRQNRLLTNPVLVCFGDMAVRIVSEEHANHGVFFRLVFFRAYLLKRKRPPSLARTLTGARSEFWTRFRRFIVVRNSEWHCICALVSVDFQTHLNFHSH